MLSLLGEARNYDTPHAALYEAVGVCDQTRGLLKRLYELRKSPRPPVSGTETLEILRLAVSLPKAGFNRALAGLLGQLESAYDGLWEPGRHTFEPRILVAGTVCDSAIIRLVEDAGGAVVCDDLCVGSRYFWDRAGHEISRNEDPFALLARHYLNKIPCPSGKSSIRTNHARALSVKLFHTSAMALWNAGSRLSLTSSISIRSMGWYISRIGGAASLVEGCA